MRFRRLGWTVAGLIALTCAAAACSSSSRAARAFSVVALGDSVPRGTNCHCTPYPPLTADALQATTGEAVTSTNDSVAGATTSDVLGQLTSDRTVRADVGKADVLEIEIGANDVGYSKTCGTSVACYAPRVPTIQKNLTAIVRDARKLAAGRKVLVVLLDYWNVWLGGQYAAARGDAYVAAAEEMTDRVDRVIKATAAKTGCAYVDLRAAFKGPDYAFDETHYLSSDGDHPNATGHEQIATAAETVIAKALRI
jgi:acyl-CoA thioesterase-1